MPPLDLLLLAFCQWNVLTSFSVVGLQLNWGTNLFILRVLDEKFISSCALLPFHFSSKFPPWNFTNDFFPPFISLFPLFKSNGEASSLGCRRRLRRSARHKSAYILDGHLVACIGLFYGLHLAARERHKIAILRNTIGGYDLWLVTLFRIQPLLVGLPLPISVNRRATYDVNKLVDKFSNLSLSLSSSMWLCCIAVAVRHWTMRCKV